MKLSCRAMAASDARHVASIQVRAWQTAYRGIIDPGTLRDLRPIAKTRKWLRRLQQGQDAWVCQSDGKILGYSLIGPGGDRDLEQGFAGEVFALYVDPQMQGRGVGRALLARSFAELERHGFLWAVVWVLEANDPARRFYERVGLQADGAWRRTPIGNQRLPIVRYAQPLNFVDPFVEEQTSSRESNP